MRAQRRLHPQVLVTIALSRQASSPWRMTHQTSGRIESVDPRKVRCPKD